MACGVMGWKKKDTDSEKGWREGSVCGWDAGVTGHDGTALGDSKGTESAMEQGGADLPLKHLGVGGMTQWTKNLLKGRADLRTETRAECRGECGCGEQRDHHLASPHAASITEY